MGKNRDFSKFPNAITVLDNGNVGIGTSTFSEGTQPAGTLSFIPNSSVSSGPLIQFSGNGRIRPASTGDRLSIDGNALYLNSYIGGNILTNGAGGNIAIGVTPPSTTNFSHLFVGRNISMFSGTSTDIYIGSNFYYDGGFKVRYSEASVMINTNSGDIIFQNTTSGTAGSTFNGAERMRVYSGGGVIINGSSVNHTLTTGDAGVTRTNTYFGTGQVRIGGGSDHGASTVLSVAPGVVTFDRPGIGGGALTINSNGHILTPSQPAFYAWLSGGTTTTTGNYAGFTSVRLNRGGHYNTSTGRFTAPTAGVYRFLFSALWRQQSGTSSGEISMSVNGSNVNGRGLAYATVNVTNAHVQCITELTISLNANDYVMPFIFSVGSGSDWYMGENLAYFTGYLVG